MYCSERVDTAYIGQRLVTNAFKTGYHDNWCNNASAIYIWVSVILKSIQQIQEKKVRHLRHLKTGKKMV